MKKLLFTANVLVAFALVSCNHKTEQKAETTPMKTESQKIAVKMADLSSTKDFACGMDLAEGEIADTASYQGKLYGFCSAECKAEFVKDPASHLTAEVKK